MSERLTPAKFIREQVFQCPTQTDFGAILKMHQSAISRFECGTRPVTREFMGAVRAAAKRRRLNWDDRWFFEVPDVSAQPNGRSKAAA